MEKTQAISLRVREGVKRDLHALAEASGLTMAQYLGRVLLNHLVQVKRLEAAPRPFRRDFQRPSEEGGP